MPIGDFEIRLVDVLLTVAIGLLTWVLRTQLWMKSELIKLRMLMTGEEGKGGLSSTVTDHGDCIENHAAQLVAHQERLVAAERDIGRLRQAGGFN